MLKKSPIFIALRPWQWVKNFVVLLPLIFSGKFVDTDYLLKSIAATFLFCLMSSAVYLINDIKDKETDRFHPLKKHRPVANGLLSEKLALKLALILIVVSLILSFILQPKFFILLFTYLLLMVSYSHYLKHIVMVDLIVVAIGFVIRAVSGAVVIQVQMSVWFLITTFFIALLLITGKRRHELIELKEFAVNHRRNMEIYSEKLLDGLIFFVSFAIIAIYSLYTILGKNLVFGGTKKLILTIPFVVLGIGRYLYLIYQHNRGGEPDKLLVSDNWLFMSIIGYFITLFICYR